MNKKFSISLFFGPLLLFIFSHIVTAQETPTDDLLIDYERVLHTEGFLPAHAISNRPYSYQYLSHIDTLSAHPWNQLYSPPSGIISHPNLTVGFYDPVSKSYWRNLKPGGINDGAVWQGRGLTSSVSSGIFLKYRFITASIRPALIYNQNKSFTLSRYTTRDERSDFSSPFYNIDNPQRFGNQNFWTFDPGPSYLKAEYSGFESGISNQNRLWGPAMHYPVVMGNNSPGFMHFFAGTSEPKDIYIGDLETTFIWGKLLESEYFDQQSYNDERYITGMTLSFNPQPVPNLTVGFSRVFYRRLPPEGIPVKDLFKVFEALPKIRSSSGENPGGNDEFDQLLSLFARWVFPDSGFELYGEWARNDHSWNWRDAVGEPEHSRAYMAGIQKTFTLSNQNILAINSEIVHLENRQTNNIRAVGSYYTHHIIHQGYTHKGQIIGSGTGPGSNSQILNGKYFFDKGRIATWLRRTVYNNDYLYKSNSISEQPENIGTPKYWLHNVELGIGSSLVYFYKKWETEVGFELLREFNEDFLYKNDKTILGVNLSIRYRLFSVR